MILFKKSSESSSLSDSDLSNNNKLYLSGHRVISDWSFTNPSLVTDFNNYIHRNQRLGNLLAYNFDSKKATISEINSLETVSESKIFK